MLDTVSLTTPTVCFSNGARYKKQVISSENSELATLTPCQSASGWWGRLSFAQW